MYKDIVKELDEVDPLIALTLIDLSNSRIETIEGDFGCEAKYFYNYVVKEQDPGNASALLGNVIHQVLENLLENGKDLDIKELEEEYSRQLYSYDETNMIDGELRDAGLQMVRDFYDANSHITFGVGEYEDLQILAKELEFALVIGRAKVRGYIDRVDIKGNRIEITDYKSGKKEYPKKHIAKNLQLGLYALALKKKFPEKEVYASLYYLRSGKQIGHLFTDDDLDRVVENVIAFTEKVTNKTVFKPTTNEFVCRYCSHAKSGVCPTGKYVTKNY